MKGEVPGEQYTYELRSINYWTLTDDERAAVRRRFVSFLAALTEPVGFKIVKDVREVNVGGDLWETPYTRFFVVAPGPIDSSLAYLGAKYARVASMPTVDVSVNLPVMMIDSESNFVQAINVTNLSGSLYVGFLSNLYGIAQEVRVDLAPVDSYKAGRIAKNHARFVGNRIIARQVEGRSRNEADDLEYRRAQLATQLIAAGRERLFTLRMSVVLRDSTVDGLRERRKRLRQILEGQLSCETDYPQYMQMPLFTGNGPAWATGRWFYVTSSTAMAFFPFAGLDIIDPEGVTIGDNMQTGNKIVYDFYDKENYNIALLGSTGAGKSTFVKSVVSRLVFKNEQTMLYVFDAIKKPEYSRGPDGTEEHSFAGLVKAHVHHYRKEEGAGLDPYKVFPEKRMATDFIYQLADLDDKDLYADLAGLEDKVNSVDDLLGLSRDRLAARLAANLKPYLFLFKGKMDIYDRMVFVLYDMPDPKTRDAAAFLTLSALWRRIREVPSPVKKAIVVDEGWAFMERDTRGKMFFPLAMEYVPEIARTGRAYNVMFLVATQMVSDFFGVGGTIGPGRAVVDNCATITLLHQDHREAADALKEKFDLSDEEREFILSAKPGDGIMLTDEGRVQFHNTLGSEEKKTFTTAPKEVTA